MNRVHKLCPCTEKQATIQKHLILTTTKTLVLDAYMDETGRGERWHTEPVLALCEILSKADWVELKLGISKIAHSIFTHSEAKLRSSPAQQFATNRSWCLANWIWCLAMAASRALSLSWHGITEKKTYKRNSIYKACPKAGCMCREFLLDSGFSCYGPD